MEKKVFKKMLLVGLMLSAGAIVHSAAAPEVLRENLIVMFAPGGSGTKDDFEKLPADLQDEIIMKLLEASGNSVQAAFMSAVENNMVWALESLLNGGADINFTDRNGSTILRREADLIRAAENGNMVRVDSLMATGALMNMANQSYGYTALMMAVVYNNVEVIEFLLAAGADVNVVNQIGREGTALQLAANDGRVDIVRLLLDWGAELDRVSQSGETALMMAVENNNIGVIKFLLAAGADVNVVNGIKREGTALQLAARDGCVDIVKLLLDRGAYVNPVGQVDNGIATPLILAAEKGHIAVVRLLIASGADVDAGCNGTALTKAARRGYVGIVELLLVAGADISLSVEKKTALQLARENGHVKVVDVLLKVGADLHTAPSLKNLMITKILASDSNISEAKFNQLPDDLQNEVIQKLIRREYGIQKAFFYAAEHNLLWALKVLMAKGAKIDMRDALDRSALMLAAREGHCEIVEQLLLDGASVYAVVPFGHPTALIYAACNGRELVVKQLLAACTNGCDTDYDKNAALIWAVRNGRAPIVKLLIDAEARIDIVVFRCIGQDVEMASLLIDGVRKQLARQYPDTSLAITHEDLQRLNERETEATESIGSAFNQVGEKIIGYMSDGELRKLVATQCRVFAKSAINGKNIQLRKIKEERFYEFITLALRNCSNSDIEVLLREALPQGHVPIVSAAQPVCGMAVEQLNEDSDSDANIAGPAPRALDCAVAWQQARNNDGFALLLEDQQREVDGGAASQERIAADREIRAQQDEEYAKSLAIDRERSERQVMLERERAETAAQELALGREREDERARIAAQEREDAANRPQSIEELRARRVAALDKNNAGKKNGGSSN